MTFETVAATITETVKMYNGAYDDDWLKQKMEDRTLQNVVKFYGALVNSAFFCRPKHHVGYIVCKAVQLSLKHGACQDTPIAFLRLSNFVNINGSEAALARCVLKEFEPLLFYFYLPANPNIRSHHFFKPHRK